MLPVWLIALLVGGAAGALIVAYWDDIVEWVTKFFDAFKNWFATHFPRLYHYAKVFIEKIRGDYATIKCKSYYQKEEDWFVKEGERKIAESEVPADILAKAKRLKASEKEADITEQVLEQTA